MNLKTIGTFTHKEGAMPEIMKELKSGIRIIKEVFGSGQALYSVEIPFQHIDGFTIGKAVFNMKNKYSAIELFESIEYECESIEFI
jgi:hypothetical protein